MIRRESPFACRILTSSPFADVEASGGGLISPLWILSREIVKQMGLDSGKWKTVHALSRCQKDDYPFTVVHNHIYLMNSVENMAKELKDVKTEYVFFAAYFQQESEEKERIIRMTGAKQYGVHLGQPKNPMIESDPWLRDSKWPPHFYYRQQDTLTSFCEKHSNISSGNYMNLASSIGIYAALSKELGQDLIWPGSETFYTKFDSFTDSKLHAQFCLWAAEEPKAANQAFNIINEDVQSWQNLWPRVTRRFGMVVKPDQFAGKSDLASATLLPPLAPITLVEKEIGLEGKVGQSEIAQRVNLEKLAEREGLERDAFGKGTWAFLGFILGRNYDVVVSMSKARDMGWVGYKDAWKSFSEVFG
ncbi:hypothetical protein B0T14DRAFT_533237 [Immersiella caudata]|uniref:PRISE-like Rossmann-fold domain-containing protein n=1 Tax=Immersiella caudata TaxID=314043 RepID=A0AA39XG07_9PEZI|nr:hypothetical protein B0T14DRAFT_533237 [Immersiella caudata]